MVATSDVTGTARPLRVLVTSTYFEPGFRGGGPVRSVARILDSAADGIAATLVTGARDLGAARCYPGLSGRWVARGRTAVFYLDIRHPGHWWRLLRSLRGTVFDLLYVNSLWAPFSIAPIVASTLGLLRVRQILIAPRGECSAGALSLKARKKRLFLAGWNRLLRRRQVRWHASTEREAADIRRLFPWARVEVNQNQSDLPTVATPPPPRSQPAGRDGPARLVFVGRIAPMKNLAAVLEALALVRGRLDLDVYGPVEDADYWRHCQALMDRLPAHVRAAYRGELAPEEVRGTFAGYDAFALLTLGENFGHVIAESLSASCPVLCSDRTPWTAVLEGGGGSVIRPPTPAALAARLEELAGRTPEDRYRDRLRAGFAYQRWRDGLDGVNILDQVLLGHSARKTAI